MAEFPWHYGDHPYPDGEVQFEFRDNTIERLKAVHALHIETLALISLADSQLIDDLLEAPEDVLVRFDGPVGQYDFDMPRGVFIELAAGFANTCLK